MLRSVRKSQRGASTRPTGTVTAPADHAGRVVGDVLLCVLFYLYLWQAVDLRLIAHGAGIITNFPVFYTGWSYLEQFLRYPGGIIEYVGALLSQLFYLGWAGAAVATAQAWLTCAATDFILKRFGFPHLRPLRFVPALILLGTYTSYSFHFVTATALTVSLLLAYALYLFLPVVLLAGSLWPLVARLPAHRIRVLLAAIWKGRSLPAVVQRALATLAFVAAGAAVVFTSQDRERKTLFAVDYCSYHRMWSRVLEAAKQCPDHTIVMHAVNRALYHTDRLGYDMFKHPQHPDALLLSGPQHVHEYWKKFDMYIELGHMNLTENGLNECIERFGEQPSLLKRLALVNLVKRRMESARVYLRALTRTLFHAGWARDYLVRLAEDPGLGADADIQQLRACVVKKDHIAALPKEDILLDLLEANPRNRMAFEYLMALYLLSRQTDRLAANYGRIENFDYVEAPPLYQEALLLRATQVQRPLDLHGHQPGADLYQRFEAMSQIIRRHGGRPAAAADALARDFGDTYFFYHLYRVSGVQK